MHDCQKLREDLTNLALTPELEAELRSCEGCRTFYQDAMALAEILDSSVVPPEHSAEYWDAFNNSVRQKLLEQPPASGRWSFSRRTLSHWMPLVGVAAAAVASVWLGVRMTQPLIDSAPLADARIEVLDDHIIGLDPGTVEFLLRSEMFLRTFVKVEFVDVEDIEDARLRAEVQLAEIDQRKEAAGDFAPVQLALEDYETVLRDINNLSMESPEDLTDIQDRIGRNGLIATMKAYQPRVVFVSGR